MLLLYRKWSVRSKHSLPRILLIWADDFDRYNVINVVLHWHRVDYQCFFHIFVVCHLPIYVTISRYLKFKFSVEHYNVWWPVVMSIFSLESQRL